MLEHRRHKYKIESSGGVFRGEVWLPGTDVRAAGLPIVPSAPTAAEAEKLVKEWIDRQGNTK